jgi:hypothetical protein
MGSGILHMCGPPERLHLGHLLAPYMRRIPNILPHLTHVLPCWYRPRTRPTYLLIGPRCQKMLTAAHVAVGDMPKRQ